MWSRHKDPHCWSLRKLSVLLGALFWQPSLCGDSSFDVHFFLAGLDPSSDSHSNFGSFVLQVRPDWAKQGAARVRELVEQRFFDGCGFFRVIPGFMAQFGISGKPDVSRTWIDRKIPDDEQRSEVSNIRGRVAFAMAGPASRTTQLFISISNNTYLDSMGFIPIGEVISGMDAVDRIYKVGEGAPKGPGPSQAKIQEEGNEYLKQAYPKLTYIKSTLLTPARKLRSHESSRELRASSGGGGAASGVATPSPGTAGFERSPAGHDTSAAGLKSLQAPAAAHRRYTMMLSILIAGAFIFMLFRRCLPNLRRCPGPWYRMSLDDLKDC